MGEPTGRDLYFKLRRSGLSADEARDDIVGTLGFTPTKEEMLLPRSDLRRLKAEKSASPQAPLPVPDGQAAGFRGAGATDRWGGPTPEELALLESGVPKLTREAGVEGLEAMAAREREPSIFAAPEKFSFVEDAAIPAAEVAAKALGISSGLFGGRLPTEMGGALDPRKKLFDEYMHIKKELEGQRLARLPEDFYDNWRKSVAQLSQGTLALGAQLLDIGEKDEGFLKGLGRAYGEGVKMPDELLAGMVGFTAHLVEHPIDTFRTHPAEALLTVMPMIPAIAKAAKRGNAAAIKALADMEAKGVIVPGAKVASDIMKLPQKIADIPIGSLKRRAPVVEVMTETGPTLTGGVKALTFGELLKSSLGGAAVALMVDEAAIGAALAPALKIFKAVAGAKGVDTSVLRRLFTDLSAMDRPRAEALLRSAILEQSLFAKDLARLGREFPELFEGFGAVKLEPAPYKPEPGTAITVREPSGVAIPHLEKALRREIAAERFDPAKNPLVAELSPETAGVLGAIAERLKEGMARARKDLAPGVKPQIDRTAMYVTQIRELLTGNAPGLLDDPVVNGAVMKYLVDTGMTPADAGAQLRLATSEWLDGRRVEARVMVPPKGWKKESVARRFEARRVGKARFKLMDELGRNPTFAELAEAAGVAEAGVGRLLSLVEGDAIPLTEVNLSDVIARAVTKSPEAQKKIIKNTIAKIVQNESKNHRARIIADTANPILDIFEEQWLKEGGTRRGRYVDIDSGSPRYVTDPKGPIEPFNQMLRDKPEVFSNIVLKMYELDKGLIPGAPVMFLPMRHSGLTPPNISNNLVGRHLDMTARALSKRHGMPFGAAKRELTILKDKIFNLEKVDELGGYLDPAVSKAFKLIDDAEDFVVNANTNMRRWTARMKKNLTVYNISSGVNNITANLLLQSISRGQPLPVVMADLAAAGMEFRAYRGKKLGDGATNRMYRSIERTGVLDNDMIAVETLLYKGDKKRRLDKVRTGFGKAFEEFYRQGDALPKLEESVRTYKKVMSELDMLKDGETAGLMVDSNTVIPIRRGADGQFYRKGQKRPLTPDELSDIVGRGSAMAAENKFFNYRDVGAIVQWMRATGLTVLSPFYTWFSKALAGRRGGLMGSMLKGDFSPIVYTDSAAILGRQLADATAQSGRRAVFSQAGNIEDRAINDALNPVVAYHGREAPAAYIGDTDKKGGTPVKSLKYVEASSPFDIGLRSVLGLVAMARGDTDAKELLRLQTEGKTPEDRRRLALAIKQARGERGNWTDGLELIGLSGNPMMELMDTLQRDMKDEHGYGRTWDEMWSMFGAAIAGGTLSKGVQTAVAVGAERGIGPIPAGVSSDPALKETAMRFGFRRMISLLPRPTRLTSKKTTTITPTKTGVKTKTKTTRKGSVDWHVEGVRKAFKKATSGALKRRAKKLKDFKTKKMTDQAKIDMENAALWDKVIENHMPEVKAMLEEGTTLLKKRSKRAQ